MRQSAYIILVAMLVCSAPPLISQTQSGRQPTAKDFSDLLERIANSKSDRSITSYDLDKLVLCFQLEEGDKLPSSSPESASELDSTIYHNTYAALDRLSQYCRIDARYVRVILKLAALIRTNVELAEAMPEYKARALRDNTKGFLDVYLSLSKAGRVEAASDLDWVAEIDAEKILQEFAKRTPVQKYRNAVQAILLQMSKPE